MPALPSFLHFLTEAGRFPHYYHVTFTTNVPRIRTQGLRPHQTSNWVSGSGERYNPYGGIYAFTHPEDAWKWAFKMSWHFHKPISVLRLKQNTQWVTDPSPDINLTLGKGRALMSPAAIPRTDVVAAIPLSFEKPPQMSPADWMTHSIAQIVSGTPTP
jgi:hypothetical protein